MFRRATNLLFILFKIWICHYQEIIVHKESTDKTNILNQEISKKGTGGDGRILTTFNQVQYNFIFIKLDLFISLYLSIYLFISIYIYISLYLSLYLFISIYLSLYIYLLYIYLYISLYLSINLFISIFIYIFMSIYFSIIILSIFLSILIFINLSAFKSIYRVVQKKVYDVIQRKSVGEILKYFLMESFSIYIYIFSGSQRFLSYVEKKLWGS